MPAQRTDLKAKLCTFNGLVRRGDRGKIMAFLAQHGDDKRLALAIKLQEAIVCGFSSAAQDVKEIVRRLTTSPG